MKLYEILNTPNRYDNWIRYTETSLKDDFEEYKKKEDKKWKDRAKIIGAKFPIFDTISDFKKALDDAKIIDLHNLNIHNLSDNDSIEDIEQMVSGYQKPRDVQKIKKGIENNDIISYPIIIQGSKGMWILAGNTRQAVSKVLQVKQKGLLVNVH